MLAAFYRFAAFRDAEAERCHAFRISIAARSESGLFLSKRLAGLIQTDKSVDEWVRIQLKRKMPGRDWRGAGPEAWTNSEKDAFAIPSLRCCKSLPRLGSTQKKLPIPNSEWAKRYVELPPGLERFALQQNRLGNTQSTHITNKCDEKIPKLGSSRMCLASPLPVSQGLFSNLLNSSETVTVAKECEAKCQRLPLSKVCS